MAVEKSKIQNAANLLDQALQQLREERDRLAVSKEQGGRELSVAITDIENGCMWMIRSMFVDKPYTPMRVFNEEQKPAAPQNPPEGGSGQPPQA